MRLPSIKSFLAAVPVAICVLVLSLEALARPDHYTPSTAYEIGYAFYKLAGSRPDFNRWVERSEAYQMARLSDRPQMLVDEGLRMRQDFKNFDPATDFLVIKTDVTVHIPTDMELKAKRAPRPYLTIQFEDDSRMPYFPFEVAGQWIAVGVGDLKSYQVTPLTDRQTADMRQMLNHGPYKGTTKLEMVLKLRPVSVDAAKPLLLDGQNQWMMMTEVAELSLWGKGDKFIWERHAETYESPTQKELGGLFRE